MVTVRKVQVSIDEIADVISVWHGLMPATGAMHMPLFVATAGMAWRAAIRVCCGYFDHVLVNMIIVHMMQVTIMEVVNVVAMANRGVAAIGSVNVRVVCVLWI